MTSGLTSRAKIRRLFGNVGFWQGALGIILFFALWQGARTLGYMTIIPSPVEVIKDIPAEVQQEGYWQSWVASTLRVFGGFFAASISGITLGILLGTSRKLRYSTFPIFEILRPIPPLAWLPLAILFWPTAELTITFLTFIGAFFPIFINVLNGIDNIDKRYIDAARSLGSSPWSMFRRVLVPGALPSLFTGLTIAIAITWEVVIAAEMASGNHGLGYLTWNSYMTGSLPGIIVGMLSIGIAGMASAFLMEQIGRWAMPWWRQS